MPVVEEPIYPGALKRNSYVMTPMRNSAKYQLAKIVDVRKAVNPDEDDYPAIVKREIEESKILER